MDRSTDTRSTSTPLTNSLINDWLAERAYSWPRATNPHLLISDQSAYHPDSPPISYMSMRTAFDKTRLTPRQLWTDRVLYGAQQTADPVQLIRLFGLSPHTAVHYVRAALPEQTVRPPR